MVNFFYHLAGFYSTNMYFQKFLRKRGMLKSIFVDSRLLGILLEITEFICGLQVHWDKNDVDLIPDGSHVIVDQTNK